MAGKGPDPDAEPVQVAAHLVLVVDDNPTSRKILEAAVRALGHRTIAVSGGEEALAVLAEGQVDLVLLDIMMPGMDGYAVLRRMRDMGLLRHVPVLVISSLDAISDVVQAIELGATDFLAKNFDPVLLRARITTCLDAKRLRDQELEYLRQVEKVAQAARIVEATDFDPGRLGLETVASRDDSLGDLARVFVGMADKIHRREQAFRRQISLLKGSFLLLLIGLGWGVVPALSKLTMLDLEGSFGIAAWVLTGSTILMVGWSIAQRNMPRITTRRLLYGMGLALIGTVLPQVVLFAVAEHVPAVTTSIVLAMESMFVFVVAGALGIEAPNLRRFLGLCLGLACVALLVIPEQSGSAPFSVWWLVLAFAVPCLYGIEGILIMLWPEPEEDAVSFAALIMIASLPVVWPMALISGQVVPLGSLLQETGFLVPLISLVSCVVTLLLINAIRNTGAVFASQASYVVAIAGVVWGMLLLNETPSQWVWAGLACLLGGLILVRPQEEGGA